MSATTIALLPFDNLSGDPAHDCFARGFVEDIGAELSRFPTVDVLYPRAVAALLRERPPTLDTPVADHLLRGSTRRAGDVIRVAVQLIESDTERQVWAGRYDATADTLLTVQDEIAARVAGALAIHVDEARLVAARPKPLASLELYECWLRGLECLRRGLIDGDAEARRFFKRALEIDPAMRAPIPASPRISTSGAVRRGTVGRNRAPGLRLRAPAPPKSTTATRPRSVASARASLPPRVRCGGALHRARGR